MARVTYGGLVTELKGKIGGTVFQRNAYGFTAKNTPNMLKPNSQAVLNIQRIFILATQSWRSLTQLQRDAFNSYASSFPQYCRNNPSSVLSGYIVYCKSFIQFTLCGYTPISSPVMSALTFPSLAPFCQNTSGTFLIGLGNTVLGDDQRYSVSISGVYPPSRTFPPSNFRFLDVFTLEDEPKDYFAVLTSYFGIVPAVGNCVFIRVVPFGILQPQVLEEQFYRVTVSS